MAADFTVEIRGLDELLARLSSIESQIPAALDRGARRAAVDALKTWRGSVTRRTGRMRKSLNYFVRRVSTGVEVSFYVGRSGFYYRFQPDARQWTAQVEQFLRKQAPGYITRELRALLGQ